MDNLFFVKERCPLSLSIAGYLMNRGETCVEICDETQWIIPANDERDLCYAATNVIDIIRQNEGKRIFVQCQSKNLAAVILASFLSELPVYLVNVDHTSSQGFSYLLKSFTTEIRSECTIKNFKKSELLNKFEKKPLDEEMTLKSSYFPPKSNWFCDYVFFSVIPASSYSLNNYSLPNYLEDGRSASDEQCTQAIQIVNFYETELTSSWKKFCQIII